MVLTVHPEIHFREGYPHLCCNIAWMFSLADEVSVFTSLCLTPRTPLPLPGPRRRKRDSGWEDKVPVSPRKEASKQGGLTPPSSLMRPGDEAWRWPGFQPELASPPRRIPGRLPSQGSRVLISERGQDRPGLNSEPSPHVCPGPIENAPF